MQHYHSTDISHSHSASQAAHFHDIGADGNVNAYIVCDMSGSGSYYSNDRFAPVSSGYGAKARTDVREPDVYVTEFNGTRWSGGSCQDTTGTAKTQTDSNDVNAGETRPTNFTVKIWKRTD